MLQLRPSQLQMISIHAPRVGSDKCNRLLILFSALFQSTLPVWGATNNRPKSYRVFHNFNPRSPCGERHAWRSDLATRSHFNPRSPCGERRLLHGSKPSVLIIFQSTLPVWGATTPRPPQPPPSGISIHAPRVGSDGSPAPFRRSGVISIHAPRVGSDAP